MLQDSRVVLPDGVGGISSVSSTVAIVTVEEEGWSGIHATCLISLVSDKLSANEGPLTSYDESFKSKFRVGLGFEASGRAAVRPAVNEAEHLEFPNSPALKNDVTMPESL